MQSGTLGNKHNAWGIAMFRTLKTVAPRSASEQAAYSKWLDQRTDRESARADRTHGAEGVIPTPLWALVTITFHVATGALLLGLTVLLALLTYRSRPAHTAPLWIGRGAATTAGRPPRARPAASHPGPSSRVY